MTTNNRKPGGGRKPLPNKLKKVTLSVGITMEALKYLRRMCKETGRTAYDLGGQLIANSVTPESEEVTAEK